MAVSGGGPLGAARALHPEFLGGVHVGLRGISLLFPNQVVALICSIYDSFVGIMSVLFPTALVRCVPWDYYGLLSRAWMERNSGTWFNQSFLQCPAPIDLALLCLRVLVFLAVGRALFVWKEV